MIGHITFHDMIGTIIVMFLTRDQGGTFFAPDFFTIENYFKSKSFLCQKTFLRHFCRQKLC